MELNLKSEDELIEIANRTHELKLKSIRAFKEWIAEHQTDRFHGKSNIFFINGGDYICTGLSEIVDYARFMSLRSDVTPNVIDIYGIELIK